MIFHKTPLEGAVVIECELLSDERGYFARTYCAREFAAHGVDPHVEQISRSFNRQRGTLRGLHFQAAPHQEAKTIRCIQGAVYDVIVDLRRQSRTFGKWFGLELSANQGKAIHVPTEFAHGFITLEEDSMLEYQISGCYVVSSARGIHYDDPTVAIEWPIKPSVVSARDLGLPEFSEALGE